MHAAPAIFPSPTGLWWYQVTPPKSNVREFNNKGKHFSRLATFARDASQESTEVAANKATTRTPTRITV